MSLTLLVNVTVIIIGWQHGAQFSVKNVVNDVELFSPAYRP